MPPRTSAAMRFHVCSSAVSVASGEAPSGSSRRTSPSPSTASQASSPTTSLTRTSSRSSGRTSGSYRPTSVLSAVGCTGEAYHQRRLPSRDGHASPRPAAPARPRPRDDGRRLRPVADALPGRLPGPARRLLHAAPAGEPLGRRHLGPRDDQGGLHRRPEPAVRGCGEHRAAADPRIALGAAARRSRAPSPAAADAAVLPRRADARLRGRDAGCGRAGDLAVPARAALRGPAEHAGDHAGGDPACSLRDHRARAPQGDGRRAARRARHGREPAAGAVAGADRRAHRAAEPMGAVRRGSAARRRAAAHRDRGAAGGSGRARRRAVAAARGARRGWARTVGRGAARRAHDTARRGARDDRDGARMDARATRAPSRRAGGGRGRAAPPRGGGAPAGVVAEQRAGGEELLDATIKETLRLRPVVPAVIRQLQAPMTFGGWDLPAGGSHGPSLFLLHRRPDLYPDPTAFRPHRFLERSYGTYEWIPFGGGIRRCLGASFALFEMRVVLSTLLERVELQAARGSGESVVRRAITFAPARGGRIAVA